MNRLDEILERVSALRPMSGTVLRLMDVVNDPASSVDEIVDAARYDQALTARMLRVCNSAHFGAPRRIDSLKDAISHLGTLKVLQLLMAVHADALMARGQDAYGLAPGMLWQQSVAVALTSSMFAERMAPAQVNLAFTAGLLHDIGKVVLNEYVGQEFAEVARKAAADQLSFDQAEEAVLGFSSAEIGARLAERWALPEAIVRCIRHHRDPQALVPPDELVDAVYLANCVCLLCGVALGHDGLFYRADATVLARHGLGEADLERTGARMIVELKRVQAVFADVSEAPALV